MIRKEREIKVIYVLVLAVFAIFLAIPIIRLLLESFLGEAGAGISNYVEVLTGISQGLWKQCYRFYLQRFDRYSACFFYGL